MKYTILLVAFAFVLPAQATDLSRLERKIESAYETYEELLSDGLVQFKNTGDPDFNPRSDYKRALRRLGDALREIDALKVKLSGKAELRALLNQAMFLKDAMMAYFVPGGFAVDYTVKSDPVEFEGEITIGGEARKILDQLPFVGVGGSGRVRIRTNSLDEKLSQLAKLQSTFYNVLLRISAIDKNNVEYVGLVEWGKDTEYATHEDSFHDKYARVDIIDFFAASKLR